MIIDYDHNPNISTDQKLQSLKENVQMALNESDSEHRSIRGLIAKARETISAIQESITIINRRMPKSSIPINGATYKGTQSNAWEYTGQSFTVASGHRAIVTCTQTWHSGKPLGIGLHNNTSGNPPSYCIQDADEAVYRATFMIPPGTYYLYTKRATVPTEANTYNMYMIDYDFN